jgi:20S proteasome subunit beta 7
MPWDAAAASHFGGPMASQPMAGPRQHTTRPIVTGTSVIGVKYAGGVLLAADTLASYGTMAMFKDAERIHKVTDNTLMAAGGEMSDFQHIQKILGELTDADRNIDDGYTRAPHEIFHYMRAVMYQRRNKMNPLWNNLLVAGWKDGEAFLGSVDYIGTTYEDDFIATGFGSYLAIPILRKKWRPDMDEGEARQLLEDCLRILFYRDCRALNKIRIAKATEEGVSISDPYMLEGNWASASFATIKGGLDGDGGW